MRVRESYTKAELERMINALEQANQEFRRAYNALRVALGIEYTTAQSPAASTTDAEEGGEVELT